MFAIVFKHDISSISLPWQPIWTPASMTLGLFETTTRIDTELLVHHHIEKANLSDMPRNGTILFLQIILAEKWQVIDNIEPNYCARTQNMLKMGHF